MRNRKKNVEWKFSNLEISNFFYNFPCLSFSLCNAESDSWNLCSFLDDPPLISDVFRFTGHLRGLVHVTHRIIRCYLCDSC